MNEFVIRALVALLLAALLWAQARAVRGQPWRRRAFGLAAAALLAFVALNSSLAVGASVGALQIVVAAAGLVLFVAAAVSLVQSLRTGEMRVQRDRFATAAREYRKQRTAETTPDQEPTNDE